VELTIVLSFLVVVIAFACEYMDASIGMGYGTTLTPVLLVLGFSPLEVVPSVLLGQILGGLIGGFFHYKLGNVKLNINSIDAKVISVLAGFGVIGSLIAVFFAINISAMVLKTYIGLMVLSIGIVILLKKNSEGEVSWLRLIIVAIVSAFNKGLSGGGYGPLVTGGQLISGRETSNSVGSTTIAETIVCMVAFLSYIYTSQNIFWKLAFATSLGSILASPLAALTVKKVNDKNLKTVIGFITSFLGTLTLIKTFIF